MANINQFLMLQMEFFRGGNARRVSRVSYKGRRKPKSCTSGRGRSVWPVKALQNPFTKTLAVLEGSPCGSVEAAVGMTALSPAGWDRHLAKHSARPSAAPPGSSAGPVAPSQLGPRCVHPPAVSEELLDMSLAACAYRRQ